MACRIGKYRYRQTPYNGVFSKLHYRMDIVLLYNSCGMPSDVLRQVEGDKIDSIITLRI